MLIHTELFSNVFGLGLIHCGLGLGLEKIFGPRPHSFWPRPRAQTWTFDLLTVNSCHTWRVTCYLPANLKTLRLIVLDL